jgi:hypothetical protein
MATFSNQNQPESAIKYFCEYCDYGTSKKSNFDEHLLSTKHIKSTKINQNQPKSSQNQPSKFTCKNCFKEYKDKSGLWRHKKKCNINESNNEPIEKLPREMEVIMMLIKEQSDIKELILEIVKNGTHNTNNNTIYNNSHNKTFNLQFFLNETCKDAMNIMDFVDSIKLQLSDLENVGKLGYVEGISNIIVKNLKELDITQRPVHCADKKREVMYVKDEDKWEKEDKNKNKIRKVIKRIACKNQNLIPSFKDAHPDCLKSASKFSDQYNKIIVESMGGSGDNDEEKEFKIIRNISKTVIIEKDHSL